jgi:protein AaeX
MIGEFDLDGVFIPWLLLLAVLALSVTLLLRVVLRHLRVYAFVWHAGLFDTALFVLVLWLIALATADFTSQGRGLG